jgi:hypothetical protein
LRRFCTGSALVRWFSCTGKFYRSGHYRSGKLNPYNQKIFCYIRGPVIFGIKKEHSHIFFMICCNHIFDFEKVRWIPIQRRVSGANHPIWLPLAADHSF